MNEKKRICRKQFYYYCEIKPVAFRFKQRTCLSCQNLYLIRFLILLLHPPMIDIIIECLSRTILTMQIKTKLWNQINWKIETNFPVLFSEKSFSYLKLFRAALGVTDFECKHWSIINSKFFIAYKFKQKSLQNS